MRPDRKNRKNAMMAMTAGLALAVALAVTGCGDGTTSHGSNTSTAGAALSGTFVDSPVQGLSYMTPTHSGLTDQQGTFHYMQGEMVAFRLGDIMMGQAEGAPILTPIDLVPGASDANDPTVTNMIRLMQSMDMDGNPDNGITIPREFAAEASGRGIHLDMAPMDFENDPAVTALMQTLSGMGGAGMMVPEDQARQRLMQTISDMMMDNGSMGMNGANGNAGG